MEQKSQTQKRALNKVYQKCNDALLAVANDPDNGDLQHIFAQAFKENVLEYMRSQDFRNIDEPILDHLLFGDPANSIKKSGKIHTILKSLQNGYDPRPGLIIVAMKNILSDYKRKYHRFRTEALPMNDSTALPHLGRLTAEDAEEVAVGNITQEKLREELSSAIGRLSTPQQQALYFVNQGKFTYRQIADKLDIKEASLKSLVHRAYKILRTDPNLKAYLEREHEGDINSLRDGSYQQRLENEKTSNSINSIGTLT